MPPVISGDRKQLTLQFDGGLVERYLGDQAAARDQMLNDLLSLVNDLPAKLAAAGINPRGRR